MPRLIALPLALAALIALAACGGAVAPDAPRLLTTDELAARASVAADPARGTQAADELARRGASLRARAARLRRSGNDSDERADLLRRADELKSQ